MSNFRHFDFGTNEGGVQNVVSVNDDGELVTRDIQSGAVIQVILDSCKEMRDMHSNMPPSMWGNEDGQGYIAARVPITIWTNWRKEWQEKFRDYFTWQTFEIMKLNSREYCGFKCVPGKIQVPENVRTTGQ